MATSPRLKVARSVRDELTRQLLLEKRYNYLAGVDAAGLPKLGKAITRALAGFEFGVTVDDRLEVLRSKADRVLVRADGMVFNVAVIDVVDRKPLTNRIGVPYLVELGQNFSGMTGKVAGTVLPVTFQIFEIFPDGIFDGYARRTAAYKRRGVQNPKIGVGVVAIDAASGATWSNFPGLVRWSHVGLAKRAYRDRQMSRSQRQAMLESSGFETDKALLAAAGGGAVGTLLIWCMLRADVQNGQLYGAVILIVAVLSAAVSLKGCRVLHATAMQAGVAGTLAALIIAGAGHWSGLGFGLGTVVTLVAAGLVSFGLGAVANPQGRNY